MRLGSGRRLLGIAVAALLAGCASPVYNSASNEPLNADTPPNMGAPTDLMGEHAIVLSLSGGGLRAAAFAHGVLSALAGIKTIQGDLLDDVALISSVSGSSLTSAYFGLYGRAGLARFRSRVLLPGFEDGLRLSLYNPSNLLRLVGGGVNTRADFGDTLDQKIFHGATFADLYARGRPEIRIQATDLYHRVPFPFIPPLFSLLCSDLSRYSVADAVAASMAVPVVFAPIVVRNYPESCRPLEPQVEAALLRIQTERSRDLNAIAKAVDAYRDPLRARYIKLGDGGLTDNFGISTLTLSRLAYGTPYAPLTERDAVRVRRLLLIVVDGSRGPNGDWTLQEAGPGGLDLALAATDAAVDTAARQSVDAFDHMLEEWRQSVIYYRCGLKQADRVRLQVPAGWDCADVRFDLAYLSVDDLPSPTRERIEAIPTRLSLTAEQIDAAIDGGRQGTLALEKLRAYVRARSAAPRQ
jgi:NTE family protein